MKILNIAGGKQEPLSLKVDNWLVPRYTVNVDTSYFSKTSPDIIETDIKEWELDGDRVSKTQYLNMDVFEYMERTSIIFDRVTIYRFLEHVSFTQVGYFTYLVSTVIRKGGEVDVIVPNYETLAQLLLLEIKTWDPDSSFEAHNTLLTTELLNEPSCPHASIWTALRANYFWQLEGRFGVEILDQNFNFDGRSIYLRFSAKRL